MTTTFQRRTEELQRRLKDDRIAGALITEEGSVYYYTRYHSYLHMNFGRPTMAVIPASGEPSIITPTLEAEMCERTTWVRNVVPWLDGLEGEWRPSLGKALTSFGPGAIGIEHNAIPQAVRDHIVAEFPGARLTDVSDRVSEMRMVKDSGEIRVARDAGKVAIAMIEAARGAIAVGVPEYEVALAQLNAGTRKAAELAAGYGDDPLMPPTLHFLQIMSSGERVAMCHHRSTTRRIENRDPIFLCYCGVAEFRQFKIGFDRMFFVGDARDEHARMYEVAVRSQKAGLDAIRPGVKAEDVHAAYAEVIRSAGYEYPFRHGRALGYSYQERPQLKFGDKTVLKPGMIFASDGGATRKGVFRSQVGDTVLVTETGNEVLTPYPKDLGHFVIGR